MDRNRKAHCDWWFRTFAIWTTRCVDRARLSTAFLGLYQPSLIINLQHFFRKIMVMPRQHVVQKKGTQKCLGFFLQCCPDAYSELVSVVYFSNNFSFAALGRARQPPNCVWYRKSKVYRILREKQIMSIRQRRTIGAIRVSWHGRYVMVAPNGLV